MNQQELWTFQLSDQDKILAWAKDHQFPHFEFSLGGSWKGIIQAGETNWQGFCEKADPHVIGIVLRKIQA